MEERIGKYRLLKLLGQGGMGAVYLAEEASPRRRVALKVLSTDAKQALIERFAREALATGPLNHPNIVPIHEIGAGRGSSGRDYHYISMGYVEGGTLEGAMQAGMDVRRAVDAIRQVALALDAAHRAGVVHRDIKPRNILLDREGRPIVVDFGLAKLIGAGAALTRAGQIVGTPHYLSPEQARGEAEIDGRADVFALGVILYEMLAGKKPFDARSAPELFVRIVKQAPEPLPATVPAPLRAVCLRALEKKREARYQTAQDLADDLQRCLDGRPVAAHRYRRRRLAAVAVGAGAFSGAILALYALAPWSGGPGSGEPDPTALAAGEARARVVRSLGAAGEAAAAGDVGRARAALRDASSVLAAAEGGTPDAALRREVASAAVEIARRSLALEDLGAALEAARGAEAADPGERETLVSALLLAERAAEAADVLIGGGAPVEPDVRTRTALVLLGAGDTQRAVRVLDPVVYPEGAPPAYLRARTLQMAREGRLDEASRAALELASRDATEGGIAAAQVAAVRAEALDDEARRAGAGLPRLGSPEDEARVAARAIRREALRSLADLVLRSDDASRRPEVPCLQGALLLALGRDEEALSAFERALEAGAPPFSPRLLAAEAARRALRRDAAGLHLAHLIAAEGVAPDGLVAEAQAALDDTWADMRFDPPLDLASLPDLPTTPYAGRDGGGDPAGLACFLRGMDAAGEALDAVGTEASEAARLKALGLLWRAHRRVPDSPEPLATMVRVLLLTEGPPTGTSPPSYALARLLLDLAERAAGAESAGTPLAIARGLVMAYGGQREEARRALWPLLADLWPRERVVLAWTAGNDADASLEALAEYVPSHPRDRFAQFLATSARGRTGRRLPCAPGGEADLADTLLRTLIERRLPGIDETMTFYHLDDSEDAEAQRMLTAIRAVHPGVATFALGYIRWRLWSIRALMDPPPAIRPILVDGLREIGRGLASYPEGLDRAAQDLSEWYDVMDLAGSHQESVAAARSLAASPSAVPEVDLATAFAHFVFAEKVDLDVASAEAGVAAATRYLFRDPQSAAALLMRARLLVVLGDLDRARSDLDRLAQGTPTGYRLATADLTRAILLATEGRRDDALTAAARAAEGFETIGRHYTLGLYGTVLGNRILRERFSNLEGEIRERVR